MWLVTVNLPSKSKDELAMPLGKFEFSTRLRAMRFIVSFEEGELHRPVKIELTNPKGELVEKFSVE